MSELSTGTVVTLLLIAALNCPAYRIANVLPVRVTGSLPASVPPRPTENEEAKAPVTFTSSALLPSQMVALLGVVSLSLFGAYAIPPVTATDALGAEARAGVTVMVSGLLAVSIAVTSRSSPLIVTHPPTLVTLASATLTTVVVLDPPLTVVLVLAVAVNPQHVMRRSAQSAAVAAAPEFKKKDSTWTSTVPFWAMLPSLPAVPFACPRLKPRSDARRLLLPGTRWGLSRTRFRG